MEVKKMPGSIKDRVAIVGMGCTKFGERWDASQGDLLVDAAYQAFEDAGIGPEDIQAAWLGFIGGATGPGSWLWTRTDDETTRTDEWRLGTRFRSWTRRRWFPASEPNALGRTRQTGMAPTRQHGA